MAGYPVLTFPWLSLIGTRFWKLSKEGATGINLDRISDLDGQVVTFRHLANYATNREIKAVKLLAFYFADAADLSIDDLNLDKKYFFVLE